MTRVVYNASIIIQYSQFMIFWNQVITQGDRMQNSKGIISQSAATTKIACSCRCHLLDSIRNCVCTIDTAKILHVWRKWIHEIVIRAFQFWQFCATVSELLEAGHVDCFLG